MYVSGAEIARHSIAGVASIYGSFNTDVERNNIAGCLYGVLWFANPTNPPLAYPANTYPYTSTVAGGGNMFNQCGLSYARFDLTSGYVSQPLLAGDLVV
jgi:hypothetical protein